jgi:hypothetical protein
MKAQLKYCPDLRACVLEDRLVPVVPNLGVGTIVLTTGGYVLVMSPFPVTVADPNGASGSPGFLTPSAMTGSGGISGLLPANSTGVRGSATMAPTGSNGGAAQTILVGSGADEVSAPVIPPVTRNTIANDATNATPKIGRLSMDRSDVLPAGQVYQGGVSTEASNRRPGPGRDERPVDPLPIRLRSKPHRLAADRYPGAG